MKNGPFKRTNYFTGQLLTASDFQAEQEYQNGKRQLLNRYCHGAGGLCGMEVSVRGHSVVSQPGLALDCCGREIYIAEKVTSEFAASEKRLYLLVQYDEYESDPVPGQGDKENEEQLQYSRITESFRLSFSGENPMADHSGRNGRWDVCGEDHPIALASINHTSKDRCLIRPVPEC